MKLYKDVDYGTALFIKSIKIHDKKLCGCHLTLFPPPEHYWKGKQRFCLQCNKLRR